MLENNDVNNGGRKQKIPKRYSPSNSPQLISREQSPSASTKKYSGQPTEALCIVTTPTKNKSGSRVTQIVNAKSPEVSTPSSRREEHNTLSNRHSNAVEIDEEKPQKQCRACAYRCPTCADTRASNAKFQMKVLRLLHKIDISLSVATEGRPVVVEALKIGELTLPLRTIEAIKNAENSITPEFTEKLKHNLKQYVTNTPWKTAVEMMRSIMTVSLMQKLNWEGRNKGKIGFSKIAPKFASTIMDAARAATVDEFKPGAIRDKLMKVLVKSNKLEEKPSIVVAEKANGSGQPIQNGNGSRNDDMET